VARKAPRFTVMEGTGWRPDGVEPSIAALLEVVEEATPAVAAHMERSARLARVFGLELGLSGPTLDLVVRTARVHDVGKLAIRPWVFVKPGELSDSERRLAEAHSVAGQRILERKPALVGLGPLVRAVHEHWDGTGYPDGLKGSAIPVPSRVVAVCSAFDSLTHPADEHPPMSAAEAIHQLLERSGTVFDPGVVEPFSASMQLRGDRRATS
jgi:HD-GYP domain-containing protein (c-di-GMP phosphodiesterase class II)